MALQLKGFLYGHYDSRGGTVFVEADTREQADKKYVDAMFGGFVGACTPAEEDFFDGSFANLVEADECPEGCYHPRWDDDAFSFLFIK